MDAVPLVPTTDISEEQPLELEPHPDVVHVPSEEEKQKQLIKERAQSRVRDVEFLSIFHLLVQSNDSRLSFISKQHSGLSRHRLCRW